ncbi:MAG: hypothetical protein HKN76_19300 [Saprospiraceae bacterium]|nr:hypothetical protein [Saprospiraceae bacterium]
MRRISSSITLFLKIFLPTFWLVFFGAFTVAVLLSGFGKSPLFGSWIFKGGVLLFYILGATILYFTLMKLKRVERDHDYLYVTNYIKTIRYPFSDIEQISETSLVFIHLGHIKLKAPGLFGRRITFVQSRQKFEDYVAADPGLSQKIKKGE